MVLQGRLDHILAYLGSALIESTWGFTRDLGKAFYNPKISHVAYGQKLIVMTRLIKKPPCFG